MYSFSIRVRISSLATMTVLGALTGEVQATTYFVDPGGSDSNSGAIAAPFQTIQRAANAAVAGDVVEIRAGTYREKVVPPNSGSVGAPITFRAYNGESVTVSGADVVSGWTPYSGNIYTASMAGSFFTSAVNQSDQVFIDGQMMNLARWPNTAYNSVANPTAISYPVKSTITAFISKTRDNSTNWTTAEFEDTALSPAVDGYYVGAEVVVQPNSNGWSWTLSGTVIAQTGTHLTIKSRNDSGQDGNSAVYAVGSRYYLHNQSQLLDAAGEWYHDRTGGQLLLWTPDSDSPALHTVEAKRREYCFDLSNRAYITLQRINQFACYITTDNASGGDGLGYNPDGTPRYTWRGAGSVAAANHILLDGVNGKYLSHFTDVSGHFFLQWGQQAGVVLSGSDNILQNSSLQYSAGNGVALLGLRNKVLSNTILDASYSQTDGAFVNTGYAAANRDHEIAYNTMRRSGRSGLSVRALQNTSPTSLLTRIHHNDIGNAMLQDWDGGCVYAYTGNAQFLRIDHNLCHDVSGFIASGIYLDYTKNAIIDHNVIWNVEWGIHLQGDSGGVNNTLAYNNSIAVANTSGTPYGPFGFGNNAGVNNGTVIQNNLLYVYLPSGNGYQGIASGAFTGATLSTTLQWDRVPGSATDPRFVNPATFNFTLQASSPAINTGATVPSYSRDGVTVPAFNDPASGVVDKGAYEYGKPVWTAGAAPTPPTAPTGLSATGGNLQVQLAWTAPSGAVAYNVKRSSASAGPFTTLATGVTRTGYADTGLSSGTKYYYQVTATSVAGESAVTSASATTAAAPAAPTSLTATAGVQKITLTWVQSASGAITQNKVYRGTSSAGPFSLYATLSPATTTWANTGLSTGQTFYYVVTAVKASGESAYSAVKGATAQ
jgi:hypothetical protein